MSYGAKFLSASMVEVMILRFLATLSLMISPLWKALDKVNQDLSLKGVIDHCVTLGLSF